MRLAVVRTLEIMHSFHNVGHRYRNRELACPTTNFMQLKSTENNTVPPFIILKWNYISDILEPNGLSVDWENKHIFWTDAQKRRIEVVNYEGENRRTIIGNNLFLPRGIFADPIGR